MNCLCQEDSSLRTGTSVGAFPPLRSGALSRLRSFSTRAFLGLFFVHSYPSRLWSREPFSDFSSATPHGAIARLGSSVFRTRGSSIEAAQWPASRKEIRSSSTSFTCARPLFSDFSSFIWFYPAHPNQMCPRVPHLWVSAKYTFVAFWLVPGSP